MDNNRRKNTISAAANILMILFLSTIMVACGDENKEVPVEEDATEDVEMANQDEPVEWNYENTNWEEIGDNECNLNVQSPVNINAERAIPAQLGDINYEYEPFPMKIVDNGYTVQVYGTESSFITVAGTRYQFKQFHFHSPAEHTINDQTYPLEMHLVHQEEGTDNLVVLGVFIEEGQSNEFLEKVFAEIPEEQKQEMQSETSINLSDYIPPAQTFYTYIGSLTTPPCTVGVDWVLFEDPIQASSEQIQKFSDRHGDSARPVQQLKNRRVLKKM